MRGAIDLRRLEQFVTVAGTGSLGKAAAALALSQPTLTRNIRDLERSVGATLLSRGPLGTTLTDAGRRFLPRAEAILNDLERAVSELAEEGAAAHLSVAISPNFYFDLLPPAIEHLIAVEPDSNVHVWSGTREAIVDALRNNAADLGICLLPEQFYASRAETSGIRFEAFGRECVRPYAAAHDAATAWRRIEDVADRRWGVPHQLSITYRFESAFYRNQRPVPSQSLNTSSLCLLEQAAIDGALVALLPDRFAARAVARGALVALNIPDLVFQTVMCLMSRDAQVESPLAARLVGALRTSAA